MAKGREGFSTGSCAAAAAKAAAQLAIDGVCPDIVEITAPEGKTFFFEILRMEKGMCGVVKDAGDDPDVTDGLTVAASVRIGGDQGDITFAAGEGVGTVSVPGLKVPPGEPAINPVPRMMITKAVRDVIGTRGALVTIYVPGGEKTALRTFNPRLGITGGISILGTKGIVRPMNEESIFESLTLELNTFAAAGRGLIAVTFGNTGEETLRRAWNINGRCVIQSGNYVGYVLDEAVRLGFKGALLCGHPGKLLKVAAGTFNTYNRTGDGRKEALCTHAALAGVDTGIIKEIYESATTEAAISILRDNGLDFIWDTLAAVTAKRCTDRSFGEIQIEAAYIDNDANILGCSLKAKEFAEGLRNGT